MESKEEIKISKKTIKIWTVSVIVVIILAVLLTLLFVKYLPNQSKNDEINNYKKALFTSMHCQYSCPLTSQVYQNKTQLLPSVDCVKSCTNDFKALNISASGITQTDVLNDNLLKDIESVVTNCKNLAIISNGTLPTFDNPKFFSCVSTDLDSLKSNYSYLK